MKKILLFFTAMFLVVISFSQPWTSNLKKQKDKSDVTFFDYQKAFNDYWEPYNLDRGYYIDDKGEKQKAGGWKQFKRWEYYWETQIDPNTGEFPERTAYDVYKDFTKATKTSTNKNLGNWVSLGTNSSLGGYAGIGRINCIAYHPTDNNTYWVGTPAGGLWLTNDNGSTWKVLTDDNSVLGLSDIIIPSNYETTKTIYIATGDRDAWDNRSIGVLKSTDDGATWQTTGLSFLVNENCMTNRLLLDPNDDNTIIASTTKGIYKTTDGGENWNLLYSTDFIDMEYMLGNFNTLYGSTQEGEIYISNDSGLTWTVSLSTIGKRIELAVTPAESSYVYAVVTSTTHSLYAIYKSTDGGISYNPIFGGNTVNMLGYSVDGSGSGGQGWYDLAIAASPTNADLLLVGGINTWRSTDGGTSFTCVNHWIGGGGIQEVHADKHMLSFRNNGDLFECNDGGVYISTDNGTSWEDKTNGITISQMYKLGVSKESGNEILTGLQDNGSKLYYNNTWSDARGGDGMECIIDYGNAAIQYAEAYYGAIRRTSNRWESSTDVTPAGAESGAWVTPYIIDPNNPSTLYAGYSDVWKTTNKGYSWTKISSINLNTKFRSLAIAPSNTQVLYAAGLSEIYKTENGGDSWKEISYGLPSNYITYIAVSNQNPLVLWVSLGSFDSNTVYQSNDGGETWFNISDGLPEIPANCVVQDTIFSEINVLYLGTEAGVFAKIGDQNWMAYNGGLPNVKIGEIEIYYDENNAANSKLVAATYGRGLWETPLLISKNGSVELISVGSITENSAVATAVATDIENNIIESGFILSQFSGANLGDKYATKVITKPLVNNGEYSLNLSELSNATYYYIKAYVSSIFGTEYSQEFTFATNCGGSISALPAVQEFSVDSLPACWDTWDNYGTEMKWIFDNPAGIEFNSTSSNNGFATMNSAYYGEGKKQFSDLNSVHFDFSDYEYVNLIFEHNAALSAGALARFSTKNETSGDNWEVLEEWVDSVGVSGDAGYFVIDLSDLVAGHTDVVFEWTFKSENAGYWAIDDFLVDTLHAVEVKVSDENQNPIRGAEVSLEDTKLTTNYSGAVLFKSVSNTTFDYNVIAEGYYESTGSLTMNHSNIFLDIVLNRIPSSNTDLADLTLDGVTIEGFEPGKIYYTISIPWSYDGIPVVAAIPADENAKIGISQATIESPTAHILVTAEDGTKKNFTVVFEKEPVPSYNVSFSVLNTNNDPVEYATVKFVGNTASTDIYGKAIFENVTAVNESQFTITKLGYFEYEDTVSVIDKDVEVEVVMIEVGIEENSLLDAEIYPNPVRDLLYYNLKNETSSVSVKIYNVTGKLVIEKHFTDTSGSIAMKHLKPGVYLVQLLADKLMLTKRITVK